MSAPKVAAPRTVWKAKPTVVGGNVTVTISNSTDSFYDGRWISRAHSGKLASGQHSDLKFDGEVRIQGGTLTDEDGRGATGTASGSIKLFPPDRRVWMRPSARK